MEERKLNEKECLELISRMIQSTKQNMEIGSGNLFLLYGYTGAILSVLLYLLVHFTDNPLWLLGWLLMFAPMVIAKLNHKNRKSTVTTYTDKVISNVWQVTGLFSVLTLITIIVIGSLFGLCGIFGHFGFMFGRVDLHLMLPLVLLYIAIGTSITGVIIKEQALKYAPLVGFIFAIYMLVTRQPDLLWNLYFGLSLIIMMVIPGHILNFKSKSNV